MGAPVPLLDFVTWAGPALEAAPEPEAFFFAYTLALADLAEGRDGLHGTLSRKPPRFYIAFTLTAEHVAQAFHGQTCGDLVRQIRLETMAADKSL